MNLEHMQLNRQGAVWILSLKHPTSDNTLTESVIHEFMYCLDQAETYTGSCSLLIYSNHPKTWCNGIDLSWFMQQDEASVQRFMVAFDNLLLRLSVLSLPTLACINGNCYAGGALLACACDFRFMRLDKGRFCFSEIKVKIPFTPCMYEILRQLPHPAAMWQLALTGNAIGGVDGQELKVIDRIYPEETLFHECLGFAEELAEKHRPTYTCIKQGLRHNTLKLWQERQSKMY